MALMARITHEAYMYDAPVLALTPDVIAESERIYSEYRSKGIIIDGDFMSNKWQMTDGVRKSIAIDFSLDEINYAKTWAPLWGNNSTKLQQAMRVVVTSHIGTFSLSWLQKLAGAMRAFLNASTFLPDAIHNYEPEILSLLQLLPSDNSRYAKLVDAVEDYMIFNDDTIHRNNQRTLACYQSYLRFGDILMDFWANATEALRLYFFPIYFWWVVTMRLPLRPTECVLTPRECIVERDGKFYLRLRRTKLKGVRRGVAYYIDKDYTIVEYVIPDTLAHTILWYLSATRDVYHSDIDTLFCKSTQFREGGILNANDNHYTYGNLVQCLNRYYSCVLVNKYNLTIVALTEENLLPGEIGRIRLGDTRHIALINLMTSGASLSVCRELAGHQNFASSAHYYSNVKQFLNALTLCRAHPREPFIKQFSIDNLSHGGIPMCGGRCYSQAVANNDYSDCVCAISPQGTPGDCKSCRYFLDGDATARTLAKQLADEELSVTCTVLWNAIEALRKEQGREETVISQIERLKNVATTYIAKTVLMGEAQKEKNTNV